MTDENQSDHYSRRAGDCPLTPEQAHELIFKVKRICETIQEIKKQTQENHDMLIERESKIERIGYLEKRLSHMEEIQNKGRGIALTLMALLTFLGAALGYFFGEK